MSYAESVRDYCFKHYVEPARQGGKSHVSIQAGDVHKALNFKNRHPLVCSAIGAQIMEREARIERIEINGPLNGANTIFVFKVLP